MSTVRRGVLRSKKKPEEDSKKFEDLLVFGYACKLFRDDDKALYIDQGKHLIPWMGDEEMKIDRYDARGALSDLKPYEAKSGQFSRFDGLSAEEKRVEELCDQERYFALYKDEQEEALYHEEEMKRLQLEINEATSSEATYHQVPFSYSGPLEEEGAGKQQSAESAQKSIQGEIGDAVFVPPPEMDIPSDILVPPTLKLALIIQKTAQFISTQGTQMEIVLKAKQANNPMFEFLNFDSALQPYYKFVTAAIRKGTYITIEEPVEDPKPSQNDEKERTDEESDSDSYLHPSLQPKVVVAASVIETKPTETALFVHPPPDVQLLIDKTASYVARNGRKIEAIVLSKGDPRFTFLQEDHAYNPYYLHKLNLYSGMVVPKEPDEKPDELTPEEAEEKLKTERRLKAAAFLNRIKKKVTLKTAAAPSSGSPSEQEAIREAEEITSLATRSQSRTNSSDDVEVISSVAKKRSKRSRSRSPERRRRRRGSRSRSRSYSRSRSCSRDRSRERRRRHRKHREQSKDRSRREKRRHKSKDRHHKRKSRHRRRTSSPSVSRSRSRSTTASRLPSNSPSPVRSEPRKISISKPASVASSEVSRDSPLPPQLQPIQPALAKMTEGLRAKVLALLDEGPTN